MNRITNVSQLKKGDVIVKVKGSVITTLEFREIHPHNDAYSVMINDTHDGVQKFYNNRLEDEEWYLYTNRKAQWKELYQMVINNINNSIDYYQDKIKKL